MGLERTTELLSLLGDPHTRVPAFHVAGTNGKGSVVATIEALLRGLGLRVGKYTSPHLIDFRERIAVNGTPMSEADVVAFIEQWTPTVERLGATFFEATTAMAFEHFVREGVDVAVIEVGLGGRLDSTNVIKPVAAGISSIGFDHMQYLGDTLELIGREKAGIFKRGVPAVIGESDAQLRHFSRGSRAKRVRLPCTSSRTNGQCPTSQWRSMALALRCARRQVRESCARRSSAGIRR